MFKYVFTSQGVNMIYGSYQTHTSYTAGFFLDTHESEYYYYYYYRYNYFCGNYYSYGVIIRHTQYTITLCNNVQCDFRWPSDETHSISL